MKDDKECLNAELSDNKDNVRLLTEEELLELEKELPF